MRPEEVMFYILGLALVSMLAPRVIWWILDWTYMGLGFAKGAKPGACPGCHDPLGKENMIEGSVCGDGKFYCDACKAFARCGC